MTYGELISWGNSEVAFSISHTSSTGKWLLQYFEHRQASWPKRVGDPWLNDRKCICRVEWF